MSFLGCRRLFIHKPRDGKLFQHWITLSCSVRNFLFLIAKDKLYLQMPEMVEEMSRAIFSTLIELTARVFSQIVSFWQHLCFHKFLSYSVYLQGDSFSCCWRGARFFFL